MNNWIPVEVIYESHNGSKYVRGEIFNTHQSGLYTVVNNFRNFLPLYIDKKLKCIAIRRIISIEEL